MINLKKLAIIITIAILFSAFIFSLITAIYKQPEYKDFCKEAYPRKVLLTDDQICPEITYPESIAEECYKQDYEFVPIYEGKCISGYECRTCNTEYENAKKEFGLFKFTLATILGLISVVLSIYLTYKKDSLKEWLLAGFLIGGLATIFIATIEYFNDAHRIIKPIILFVEIVLVIFVSYMKLVKKK